MLKVACGVKIIVEKYTPHYKLPLIKTLIAAGKVSATFSALKGAMMLGIDFKGMLDIIMLLTTGDFYKSMTTKTDHRIWQDVYKTSTMMGDIYLKLTVIHDVLIVSFKEQ